jgi:methanethiol S-methyltransferase
LFWFTPRMTLDHALLTVTLTTYIFIGSYLKDRRLDFYLGHAYREYASRVPGYPLMFVGPLGRWSSPTTTTTQSESTVAWREVA